jgi:hypothetical protein
LKVLLKEEAQTEEIERDKKDHHEDDDVPGGLLPS